VDVVPIETLHNEPFFASKERDLIQALKETVQFPPPRPFKSMVSSAFLMSQLGMASKHTKMSVIPWDWLEVFVHGEHNYPSSLANLQRQKNTKFVIP
jgi:hypothetical protein